MDEGITEKISSSSLLKNGSFLDDPLSVNFILHQYYSTTDSNESKKDAVDVECVSLLVAAFFKELFPWVNDGKMSKEFHPFIKIVARKVEGLSFIEFKLLSVRLKSHVGIREGKYPWIDVDAAYALGILPDTILKIVPMFKVSRPRIPYELQQALQSGQYVSVEHIIYGLYKASLIEDDPEDDALLKKITVLRNPVSVDFIKEIKQCDVIRAANVHAAYLGARYPALAHSMLGLIDDLWVFMYSNKFPAILGIQLYNEIFLEFTQKLAMGQFLPIDHVPPHILQAVASNFTKRV